MAGHEFKVGDQVAHEELGNGKVVGHGFCSDTVRCVFDKYLEYGEWKLYASDLRPRNFLSKIAEEQNEKEKLADQIYQNTIDKLRADKTFDQQFNEVFNPDRFQHNAYGQLVDTVTGLPADSEGIVTITSIRESVREIS